MDALISVPQIISPIHNSTIKTFEAVLNVSTQSDASNFQFQLDTVSTFNSGSLRNYWAININYYISEQLRKGKKYHWRVRAFKGNDTSAWTNANTFTVLTTMEIFSPADNTNGGVKYFSAIKLHYNTVVNYLFEMDTTANFNTSKRVIRKITTSQLLDSQYFVFGRRIYWRVAAVNAFNDTLNWSSVYNYAINKFLGTYTVKSPSDAIVEIDWPSNSQAETILEVDTSMQFNSPIKYSKLHEDGITKDTLRNLLLGKKYYYRIRAKFVNYLSFWSTLQTFTVKSNLITGANPVNGSTSTQPIVNFSWNRIVGTKTRFQLSKLADFSTIEFDTILTEKSIFTYKDTLKLNSTYYWRLKAFHELDTLPWQNLMFKTFRGVVTLSEPANNAKSQNIDVKFKFFGYNWATSYLIEIDTGTSFGSIPSSYVIRSNNIKVDNSSLKSFDTILRYNQNYVWRVFAIRDADTSVGFNFRTFKTIDIPKLDYPVQDMVGPGTSFEGVIFFQSGATHILWDLDTSADFNSPMLVRGKDTNVLDVFFQNRAVLSFPRDLRFETAYFWRARMLSIADTSQWSTTFKFTTTQRPWVQFPANNSVNLALDTSIRWVVQGSVNDYVFQYQISTDSSLDLMPINSLIKGTTSQAKLNLEYGKTYYWRGRAIHSKDTSEWSDISKFTTIAAPTINKVQLVSPLNRAINVQSGSIALEWKKVANARSYDVEVASDSLFVNKLASRNLNDIIINLTGITANNMYFWRVRGRINQSIVGPWSDTWKFSTIKTNNLSNISLPGIHIYPNPASESFNIDIEEACTIQIYSFNGQLVKEVIKLDGETLISVADLVPGIYLVKIKSDAKDERSPVWLLVE